MVGSIALSRGDCESNRRQYLLEADPDSHKVIALFISDRRMSEYWIPILVCVVWWKFVYGKNPCLGEWFIRVFL